MLPLICSINKPNLNLYVANDKFIQMLFTKRELIWSLGKQSFWWLDSQSPNVFPDLCHYQT